MARTGILLGADDDAVVVLRKCLKMLPYEKREIFEGLESQILTTAFPSQ